MRGIVLESFTGPAALQLVDLPEPTPKDGEVVVRVEAVGLGSWDVGASYGIFVQMGGTDAFPQVPGWDFAGTIIELGAGADGWSVGDRVLGLSPQPWNGIGVLAERAAIPTALLAHRPDGLDAVGAATLPVPALTAELLLNTAAVAQDQRIVVIGASGAVGGLAAQLAAGRGASVAAPVRAAEYDDVRARGAEPLDRDGDLAAQIRSWAPGGIDAIIDLVGGAPVATALGTVRDGGIVVTAVLGGLPELDRGIRGETVGVGPNPATLQDLAARVGAGRLTAPRVATRYSLADTRAAFELVAAGTAGGKVVIEP